ncbi:hypothetical protein HXY32_04525 [Candidatus Bathyarchaeota archaeon]|nr:hypothetical protein [Candidatus Bathyarchaeota archaeon]
MCSSINKSLKLGKEAREKTLKKTALTLVVATVVMILISIPLSIRTVEAANGDYSIERVNHTVNILYNGYILINDTIRITGQVSDGFLMGFPYKYGPYILKALAYNESDVFPVTLNVRLEDRIGFYGIKIDLPQGVPHEFTVGFILSNNLISQSAQNKSRYLLDFPAYPSFTKPTGICNGSVVLRGASYISSTIVDINGTVANFTYQQQNLPAFTFAPANVTFLSSGEGLQLSDVKELKREIILNEVGEIAGKDSYYIINKGLNEPNSIEVVLPPNASNPRAEDQFGRTLAGSSFVEQKSGRYKILFTLPLRTNESTRFAVQYSLPNQVYIITQDGTNLCNFTSLQFLNVSYYIDQASLTFVLPEGAKILTYENFGITRGAFQESLTLNFVGISPLEDLFVSMNALQVTYQYNPLWLAFRPTLWMWAITIISSAVFMIGKRPRAPTKIPTMPVMVTAKLRPEDVRSFVSAYEEKRKLILNLESLESKLQKGRIPRRRYKVQRKTLETRLNSLSRTINESKEKMRVAGSQYAELMRSLESAETEIHEVETSIKNIEARHSRGDLSLEAYRKLLVDYQRRREKANITIDGILLRLREESR